MHGDLKGVSKRVRNESIYTTDHSVIKNNVLVDDDGNVKITDFGRAFAIENNDGSCNLLTAAQWTAPELLVHGPDYDSEGTGSLKGQSPEQTSKPPLTLKSDIWAFGITVLEVRLWSEVYFCF